MPASGLLDLLADLGRAGEGDLVDAGVSDERRPGSAVAGDDVHGAGRQAGLLAMISASSSAVSGVVSAGLSTQVLPVASAGRELPRRHQQREVPGDHLPGDPERAGTGAEPGVGELVGPARVVEEMRRGERDVHVPGLLDRLAVVQALQHRELAGALLDGAGDPVQVLGPLPAGHRAPACRRRFAGRATARSTSPARPGDLGQHLLGGRVQRLEVPPVGGRDELAVDEQAVLAAMVTIARDSGAGAYSQSVGAAWGCVLEQLATRALASAT